MSLCSPLRLHSISRSACIFFSSFPSFSHSVYYCYHVHENCLEKWKQKILGCFIATFHSSSCISFRIRHDVVTSATSWRCVEFVTFNSHNFIKEKVSINRWWSPYVPQKPKTHLETPHKNSHSPLNRFQQPIKWIIYVNMFFIIRNLLSNAVEIWTEKCLRGFFCVRQFVN